MGSLSPSGFVPLKISEGEILTSVTLHPGTSVVYVGNVKPAEASPLLKYYGFIRVLSVKLMVYIPQMFKLMVAE